MEWYSECLVLGVSGEVCEKNVWMVIGFEMKEISVLNRTCFNVRVGEVWRWVRGR